MASSATAYEVSTHALAAGISAPQSTAYLAHIRITPVSVVVIWIMPVPKGLVVKVIQGVSVLIISRIHIGCPLYVGVAPVIPASS